MIFNWSEKLSQFTNSFVFKTGLIGAIIYGVPRTFLLAQYFKETISLPEQILSYLYIPSYWTVEKICTNFAIEIKGQHICTDFNQEFLGILVTVIIGFIIGAIVGRYIAFYKKSGFYDDEFKFKPPKIR